MHHRYMHPQETLRFTPPPRRVPLSLRIVNVGNFMAQIGWFVFGFGMIFFWAFAWNADLSFVTFRGPISQTTGRITHVEETGSSENDTPVEANHYEFSVAGQRFQGTSYTTGESGDEGDEVTVEYFDGDPLRSRIAGMRRAQFSPLVLLVAIFPLIGAGILVPSMLMGRKRNLLLRDGILTAGVLESKEPTNMTVNDRRVYALTFVFTARDGQRYRATARSTDTRRLEDEAQEPLLYDPNDPARAYVLDEAPARPQFNSFGEFRGRPIAAIVSLALPAIVLAGHGLALALR